MLLALLVPGLSRLTGARLKVYVSGGEKGAFGLSDAEGKAIAAVPGDREPEAFAGDPALLPETAAEADDEGPATLADADVPATLLCGGNGGESSCAMDGLVKGLTMVVLETLRLAGGEKDVWTG